MVEMIPDAVGEALQCGHLQLAARDEIRGGSLEIVYVYAYTSWVRVA